MKEQTLSGLEIAEVDGSYHVPLAAEEKAMVKLEER